jgi:transcriptional regulator with XRE-family HTH domain
MERKKKYIHNNSEIIKFGKRIRILRTEKDMSMQELADLTDIEYSQISRIERGLINTSLSNIFAIAKTLGVKPQELFE